MTIAAGAHDSYHVSIGAVSLPFPAHAKPSVWMATHRQHITLSAADR
jgi:hypothetical protein